MAQYAREEIMSSSEVVRNFGSVLNSVVQHHRKKIAIIRNNRLEAVLVAADVYESLENASVVPAPAETPVIPCNGVANSTVLLDFLKSNRSATEARLSQEQIDLQIREEREAWD